MVNTRPKKYTAFVGFRVTPRTKRKLDKKTRDEMRTITAILRHQLLEMLKS